VENDEQRAGWLAWDLQVRAADANVIGALLDDTPEVVIGGADPVKTPMQIERNGVRTKVNVPRVVRRR
jgi:hypothetical protein